MATQTPTKNVPKLRFPEFEGGWKEEKLTSLSSEKLQNGVFNDPSKVGTGYKLINVKDMYTDGFIDESFLSLLELSEKEFKKNKVIYGDTFFTRSSLVKEGIAHSNVYLSSSNNVTYDGHLIRLRPNPKIVSPRFLYFLLKTSAARKEIISHGKTGTMTTIGQDDLSKCSLYLPFVPEQQKIAGFLTAVDERLDWLRRKKDLLTQYKTGLMHQLFSQQRRFTDAHGHPFPDWEEKRLGKIIQCFSGGTPTSTKKDYYNGTIPFIGSGEINSLVTEKYINELALNDSSAKLVNKGDLLFALYGATSGEVAISKISGAINQAVLCIRSAQNVNYLYQLLSYLKLRIINKYLQGGQGNLSAKIVKELPVKLPHIDEQQKIAACLSAVDGHIAHVAQQLAHTQAFKQGLLQQLFV